jgi:hypothetical protein
MSEEVKKPNPVGRPTKYHPDMCKTMEDKLSKGHSIQASCSSIDVVHSTVYEWMAKHKEFSDAIKRGVNKGLVYLEELIISHAEGEQPKNANVSAVIFILKTRFHKIYSEKQHIEQSQTIKIEIDENESKI